MNKIVESLMALADEYVGESNRDGFLTGELGKTRAALESALRAALAQPAAEPVQTGRAFEAWFAAWHDPNDSWAQDTIRESALAGWRAAHDAQPAAEPDEQDAKRYRWLRKEAGPWQAWARQKLGTADLDAAIDAAMKETP